MSFTYAATTFGDTIVIRYDGLDAERHEVDLNLLAESMKGLARIIGVSGNFAATGKLILRSDLYSVKVLAQAPERHCFELSVVLRWISENPLVSTTVGGFVVALVGYVCKKVVGDREEMKQLRGALDNAIRELGTRDQAVIDRLLGTIDRMADTLRPAVRQAVAPISETAAKITISDASRAERVSLGPADKEAALSTSPLEVGPEDTYRVRITEMDMETGACKLQFSEEDENRLSGKITDPAFILQNNVYVTAMADKAFLQVIGKPTLKNGEMERLFISNIARHEVD